MKFREWFDDYPKIEILPWERKGRLGNELVNTTTGGMVLPSPFQKRPKTELPTFCREPKKDGLGDLGMKEIGNSTFNLSPIPAGGTPTISNGFPV